MSHIRVAIQVKNSLILEIIHIERRQKARKSNNSLKPKYISYIGLINDKTKNTEYYRLYKDNEIGFDIRYQRYIQDSVVWIIR